MLDTQAAGGLCEAELPAPAWGFPGRPELGWVWAGAQDVWKGAGLTGGPAAGENSRGSSLGVISWCLGFLSRNNQNTQGYSRGVASDWSEDDV